MLFLLKQRNFSLFWFAGLISSAGDWVLLVALPVYVYEQTQSILASGIILIVQTLPSLLGSIIGIFVDRWDRKRTMIVADLVRAFLVLLILLVDSVEKIWIIYVVAFLGNLSDQFFYPAKGALLPHLVSEDDLIVANSMNSIGDNVPRLIGPMLGGMLMGWTGLKSVVILDSATFLVSALMIYFIVLPKNSETEQVRVAQTDLTTSWQRMWSDWLDGLRILKNYNSLIIIFFITGLTTFSDSLIGVLFVPFVNKLLNGDVLLFGWLMTARGVGGLVGGLITGLLGKYLARSHLASLGLIFTGLAILMLIIFPITWLAVMLFVIIGIAVITWSVSIETEMQISSPEQYRGRIYGSYYTSLGLLGLTSLSIAAVVGDYLGIVSIFAIAGSIYLFIGVLTPLLFRRPHYQTKSEELINQ